MSLVKNQLIEGLVDGYTAEGAGVVRADGMAVFVPGAVRGDNLSVRIVKVLKNRAYGKIEAVLQPSDHRIDSECPHFPMCGGCDFWHMDYEEELWLKHDRVQSTLRRLGGFDIALPPVVPSPKVYRARNKAVFPVRDSAQGAAFGFFRSRSHQLVALDDCLAQDTRAVAIAHAVCRWADECGTSLYNEETGKGFLRNIMIRTDESGSQLCLTVQTGKVRSPERLIELCTQAAPDLRGILLSTNDGVNNRVAGVATRVLWGEERLESSMGELRFLLSPLSFYQVNHEQAQAVYDCALEFADLRDDMLALDLYCGIGTITLHLAKQAGQVIGAEIVPQAVRDAGDNAAQNGMTNVSFTCADASQAAQQLAEQGLSPDVIVVDPPRKGLDAQCIDALLKMAPKRIVYIACDPSSVARDAALLRDGGGYSLTHARAFDMFPKTANVDTVCVLRRGS